MHTFSGPDAIRDHQVAVDDEHRYVGEGTMSPEGTSEVEYLWRAPKGIPFPRPKSSCVGEIGWGVPRYTDWRPLQSGRQIQVHHYLVSYFGDCLTRPAFKIPKSL